MYAIHRRTPLRWLTLALLASILSFSSQSSAQSPYFPNTQPAYNPNGFSRNGITAYGIASLARPAATSPAAPAGFRPLTPALSRQIFQNNPAANRARGIYDFPYTGGYNQPWTNPNSLPGGYWRY